ncbi:hypothetical protein [Methylobacterium aquaticum]|uniref:hypothetical protein n=1 Tax=Methylobacterium aquaticum TaxID=270351 RepID=UPI0019339D6C|nr:hypothetical protein [Methylobacterium aquaticum]QRE73935.1 hypothetical protein F1D61_10175 [Methylobacterium aquaticum]
MFESSKQYLIVINKLLQLIELTGMKKMSAPLKFLNVDIDIIGPTGGQVIANYFRQQLIILQNSPSLLSFEPLVMHSDANSCIASLACLIRAMPSDLKLLWSHSAARYFNVGYEGDLGMHSVTAEISSTSLQVMGEIGAQLRITIYAPQRA